MSKDKLIILADKLDRNGHTKEAALIDEVLVKKSFDEKVRADVKSVLDMVLQFTEELQAAVDVGVAGLESEKGSGIFIKGFSGKMEESPLKDFYVDKLRRIKEGVEYAQEFTDLSSEGDSEGDSGSEPVSPGPSKTPGEPEPGAVEGGEQGPSEGGARPDDGWKKTVEGIEEKRDWWQKTLDRMNKRESEESGSEEQKEE